MQQKQTLQDRNNEEEQANEEAAQIERESCIIAKEARMQLDKALLLQESTLNELKKQGEVISQVKVTALKVLENSKASCETQFRIKEEKNLLPNVGNFLSKMKRWFKKNVQMEKEIEEIKGRKENVVNEIEEVSEENFVPVTNEVVEGVNATNSELTGILNSLKKVNAGAKSQIEIMKGQKRDVKDIAKIGEFSCEIVNETEKQMNLKK